MKKRNAFSVMLRLIGLVKPLTGWMILAVLMGFIGHLCASFITILGGYGVLKELDLGVEISLRTIFILMAICAVLRGVLRYAEQACNHFIAFKLLALIRDKIFCALRKLSPAKLEGKDRGNLIAIITSDVELLEVFYAHTISPAFIAFLFTLTMCLFIGGFSWVLGVVACVAYLTVGVIIPIITAKRSSSTAKEYRMKSGDLSSFVLDSLRGLFEIIQYGAGKKRLEEMNRRTAELSHTEEKSKHFAAQGTALMNTVILFFDLIMLVTAAVLYQNGTVNFEGVIIPLLALMSTFGPVVALANLGSTLQNTLAAGNRVLDILEEEPAVQEMSGQPQTDFNGAAAENIRFAYGDQEVLSNFSLQIPKHGVVGIIGKSGSGKSTFLKLLMRFWDIQDGSLTISGRDIQKINTADLRKMESYMTQETHLFQDSIANNLRIANLHASQSELETACKKASVHNFIMSLRQGYETKIGELGDTLSGGERQRLGLARSFLHDAPFMLLDEPTSNLDSLNEAVILKSLREGSEGRAIVLVSHRKSTMRIVDTVYFVENGRMC